jgi:hypothetical protein
VLGTSLLSFSWAASSPPGASPDETHHIWYSYGVVSGEALPWNMEFIRGSEGRPRTLVEVPATLLDFPLVECYVRTDVLPGACGFLRTKVEGEGRVTAEDTVVVRTNMTAYPLTYYVFSGAVLHGSLAVGLTGLQSLLMARALSGVLFFAMIGGAAFLLARRFPRRGVYAALLAACTPMAVYMATSINPNGFEIAAGALAAACVVAARSDLARHGRTSVRLDLGLLAAFFALAWCRPLSIAWACCLAVVLLLPRVARGGRPLMTMRRTTVAALAVMLVAGIAWMLWTDRIRQSAGLTSEVWDAFPFVLRSTLVLLKFGDMAQQGVGMFGWAEVPMPVAAVLLWTVVVTATLAAMVTGRRPSSTGLRVAALFFALSAFVVYAQSMIGAFGWQGRYWLPALAATAVLAVPSLQDRVRGPDRRSHRVTVMAALLLALNLMGLAWNLWRHVYGYTYFYQRFESVPYPWEAPGWIPPGGTALLLATAAVGLVLVLLTVLHAARPVPGARHEAEILEGAAGQTSGPASGEPTAR